MPRHPRTNEPGVVYHVISEFVDKAFFITTAEDRRTYLRFLAHGLKQSDWRCLGYAIMSNHLHHAFIAGRMPFMSWAHPTNSMFATWMNRRHGKRGPLFAERADDHAYPRDRVGALLAYIHNNPVRARVVKTARNSTWTSHRAYIGTAKAPPWLHVDEGLALAGFDDGAAFDAYVRGARDEPERFDVRSIARAARHRGGLTVGTPSVGQVPLLARPFAHVRPDPALVVAIAASVCGIEPFVLCSRRRVPAAIHARRATVHAAKRLGLSGGDIAAALGISQQAVSQIAKQPFEDTSLVSRIFDRVLLEALPRAA